MKVKGVKEGCRGKEVRGREEKSSIWGRLKGVARGIPG